MWCIWNVTVVAQANAAGLKDLHDEPGTSGEQHSNQIATHEFC